MLKKITKLILITLIMIMVVPVFAKASVSIESVKLVSQSENLNVTDTKNMNVSFNDLDQYVKYEVTLKNNTDKKLFVNELKVDNSSQDFIHYGLDDKSVGKEISSGKTTKVNIFVKTLEIEGAGRNTNDNINLRFMLGDSIKNPATGNNKLELIVSILLISLLIFLVCYKKDTKVKVSIIIITLMLVGTTSVLADDVVTAELEGNVSYNSQNLMQSSGTTITNNEIDYSTSEKVWKYYDKVKNVNISSVSKFEKEYEEEFDLTIGENSRVKGYLVKSDAEDMYDLHIASRGVIYAPADSTALFSFPKVEKINGLENVVFEETKTFTGMFMGNEEMKEANVESIDFRNAEDTSHMFTKCYEIEVEEETLNIPEEAKSENTFIQYLYDEVKKNTTSDKNEDFSQTTVTGKYYIESTKNDEYPVYYYRGAVTNNNVIFGNKCWKIVRTTETGGIKLTYNGTTTNNQCTGANAVINSSTIVYGNGEQKNYYIYKNSENKIVSSTAKINIEKWYETEIEPYDKYKKNIEDTPWCMERNVTHTTSSYKLYAAFTRLLINNLHPYTELAPTLNCSEDNILRVNTANDANKLKYPVALLTADEVVYAGCLNTNNNCYLKSSRYTRINLLTPAYEDVNDGYFFYGNNLSYGDDRASGYFRPAISLKPNIDYIDGTGTSIDPYIIN